ncbi:MAG: nicotinate-nucleotide adenylyltransferase [Chromatiales bacterium]|nr:nicotinate-nucleotide adenylyltransferase [Chromatiales bacterium]
MRTALDVQQSLGLQQVRLMPLRDPPHREQPNTTATQRLAMLQAAIAEEPHLTVDERELQREGKSYTIDTLRSLRRELGDDLPICWLLGTDAFRGFPDWHQPEEILKLAHLVVMARPGETPAALYAERTTNDPKQLTSQSAGLIYHLPVTQLEVSSTRIRSLIGQGLSPKYLLPDAVLRIIEQERLYR